MKTRTAATTNDQPMRTTLRSQQQIATGSVIEHLSTEWVVLSCSRALPSLHYPGFIVTLVEAPIWY